MNDFLTLAEDRWSVRQYSQKPVEEEKIHKILEAAQHAPTAVNYQPQMIYILKSREARAKTGRVTYDAPLVFLVCYDTDQVWWSPVEKGYNTGEQDAAIVTTHMMLEAWDLGLGSVWIRGFDAGKISKAFDLPDHIVPACMLSVGYAAENAVPYRPWHNVNKDISEFTKVL